MESPKTIAMDPAQLEQVHTLARSMSHSNSADEHHIALAQTRTSLSHTSAKHVNPFEDTEGDETLDPRSEKFDINAWLKNIMHIASRDPENFPVCQMPFSLSLRALIPLCREERPAFLFVT
jgi:hypothetical protein